MHNLTYPSTRIEPVCNDIGGVRFEDPYQWLEADDQEVLHWEQEQARLAHDYIREWPGWSELRKRFENPPELEFAVAPVRRGSRWFRQVMGAGAASGTYQLAPAPAGPWRTVFDPSKIDVPGPLDMTVTPSPDGRLLAVAYGPSGLSADRLALVDADSGRPVRATLEYVIVHSVAWLADGSGFYFVAATTGSEMAPGPVGVFLHRLGEPAPPRLELSDLPHPYVEVRVSGGGRDVLVFVDYMRMHPHFIRRDGGAWEPFITDPAHLCRGETVGDDYFAITTLDAPRGRLVRVPIATASEPATWSTLVPAGDAVLTGLCLVGDRLVVPMLADGLSRVRLFEMDGSPAGEVRLPGVGALAGVTRTALLIGLMDFVVPCDDAITFVFTTFDRPATAYICGLPGLELTPLGQPVTQLREIAAETRHARSADGTSVPYTLVYRRGTDITTPHPALINGYGGFNVLFQPAFLGMNAPFVEAGGVFIHANLRGGGELGADWWAGGRLVNKQNTFDDLYAVAEQLVLDGVTTPQRLSLMGGSNGGLLVATAATQRPDLWRAIVCLVPMLDLMRSSKDPQTLRAMLSELGNPADPGDAERLFRYSPYHNVRMSTEYPAILFAAGDSDPVCPAWHSRKMAARLQAATSSRHPILLDVFQQAGHALEHSAGRLADQATDWMAFLMKELELELTPSLARDGGDS
jgi:prolyl oligopeptidase